MNRDNWTRAGDDGAGSSVAARQAPARAEVLVVSDDARDIGRFQRILGRQFQPMVEMSRRDASQLLGAALLTPDLIFVKVDGQDRANFSLVRSLKSDTRTQEIPVIAFTQSNDPDTEDRAFESGVDDYVAMSLKPAAVRARVRSHIQREALRRRHESLVRNLRRGEHDMGLIKQIGLKSLALMVEKRDSETGNHLVRTQAYLEALILELKHHPRFQDELAEPIASMIIDAAPIHDIGKMAIPDFILLKPGKLTPDEYEMVKTHSRIGADILAEAIDSVLANASAGDALDREFRDKELAFLRIASQIALSHHEKWDGSGYPEGLKGEAIPLPARLMALADVFDALSQKRHYKPMLAPEAVDAIIRDGRGRHFDPDIVDAYFQIRDVFQDIRRRFADAPAD